jgi:hypothetical protein
MTYKRSAVLVAVSIRKLIMSRAKWRNLINDMWPRSGGQYDAQTLGFRRCAVDCFHQEEPLLRVLPVILHDSDEIVPTVVIPYARIEFNSNRYSVPPTLARRSMSIRADHDEVRVLHKGRLVAQHVRCY